jgi:hypothetical protein
MIYLAIAFILIGCDDKTYLEKKKIENDNAIQACLNACPKGIASVDIIYGNPKCVCRP